MARLVNRLTDQAIRNATAPGYYGDGGGLYLQVSRTGTKSWVFRFSLRRRAREAGLGSLREVGLVEARRKAAERRLLRDQGIDPIEAKNAQRTPAPSFTASPTVISFRDFAESYIASREHEFKNEQQAREWRATLERYAFPIIGHMALEAIETKHILEILEPIWRTKSETASRLRGRIERILASASVRGLRNGNCALWQGHLREALPAKRKAVSHPAMPYAEVPSFLVELRNVGGFAPRVLEYTILTAARSGESYGARWPEIDLNARTWTVPAERMKAGRAHVAPLNDRALAILEEMKTLKDVGGGIVFPGMRPGRSLSVMAMLQVLRHMGRSDVTVHGFRSSFRDWCADQTDFPREVAEAALAHVVGDKTEAAYLRTTMLAKRRALMDAWAAFCCSAPTADAAVQHAVGR